MNQSTPQPIVISDGKHAVLSDGENANITLDFSINTTDMATILIRHYRTENEEKIITSQVLVKGIDECRDFLTGLQHYLWSWTKLSPEEVADIFTTAKYHTNVLKSGRLGQNLMNALLTNHWHLARRLDGTEADCFFDDDKIPKFVEEISK